MIRPERFRGAVEGLHTLLVLGRYWALTGEPTPGAIATLLDNAEVLARFLIDPGDSTETYRMFLVELGKRYPDCDAAVAKFDE